MAVGFDWKTALAAAVPWLIDQFSDGKVSDAIFGAPPEAFPPPGYDFANDVWYGQVLPDLLENGFPTPPPMNPMMNRAMSIAGTMLPGVGTPYAPPLPPTPGQLNSTTPGGVGQYAPQAPYSPPSQAALMAAMSGPTMGAPVDLSPPDRSLGGMGGFGSIGGAPGLSAFGGIPGGPPSMGLGGAMTARPGGVESMLIPTRNYGPQALTEFSPTAPVRGFLDRPWVNKLQGNFGVGAGTLAAAAFGGPFAGASANVYLRNSDSVGQSALERYNMQTAYRDQPWPPGQGTMLDMRTMPVPPRPFTGLPNGIGMGSLEALMAGIQPRDAPNGQAIANMMTRLAF